MQTIDPKSDSIERAACRLANLAPLLPLEVNPGDLFPRFYALCQDQQWRLDNRLPICPVPLWVVAMLDYYGFRVDIDTGCIVRWPCPLPDWMQIEADMDTGRIIRWPVNEPVEVRP